MTFAPCARPRCAWFFCCCGSACAFTTVAAAPAFLKAAFRYGASNSVYRVDETVSGSSAHTLIDAACFVDELVRADAAAAISPTRTVAVTAAIAQRGSFFTFPPSYETPWCFSYHTGRCTHHRDCKVAA